MWRAPCFPVQATRLSLLHICPQSLSSSYHMSCTWFFREKKINFLNFNLKFLNYKLSISWNLYPKYHQSRNFKCNQLFTELECNKITWNQKSIRIRKYLNIKICSYKDLLIKCMNKIYIYIDLDLCYLINGSLWRIKSMINWTKGIFY